jgi:DNA polymerase-3 subunit epsilon
LCRRFNIDNSARTLHGALLDSEILAEVYLELIGGRQPDFGLSDEHNTDERKDDEKKRVFKRARPLKTRLTSKEEEAHTEFVRKLGESAMWNKSGIKT